MSRIGRLPIGIPDGVKLQVADGSVRVEGPKGVLTQALPEGIGVDVQGSEARVTRADDTGPRRGLHGMTRKLVANMVEGVSRGFTRNLEISGVGYRAEPRGRLLMLSPGYSHPIAYQLPEGVTVSVERQVSITLQGFDRQLLGEVAAAVRALRPPEPYKGKGIRYAEEQIRRKAGKAAAGAGH
jgi:large subunit ribosomal protein L6